MVKYFTDNKINTAIAAMLTVPTNVTSESKKPQSSFIFKIARNLFCKTSYRCTKIAMQYWVSLIRKNVQHLCYI